MNDFSKNTPCPICGSPGYQPLIGPLECSNLACENCKNSSILVDLDNVYDFNHTLQVHPITYWFFTGNSNKYIALDEGDIEKIEKMLEEKYKIQNQKDNIVQYLNVL